MNTRSGRKRLFLTLVVVVVLLGGGVAGILYFSQARQTDGQVADGATDAVNTGQSGTAVAASDRGQSSSEGGEGSGDEKDGKKKAPIPVSVTPIRTGQVSSYITSTANLVAEDDVDILAEAEGRIEELNVEEGDPVRRGQVLAALVKDDAEIALKKAHLKLKNAQLAYERAVEMVGEQLMAREEYDKTQLEHDIAKQELAEAEWRLEKTFIRAPFSGFVTGRMINLGQNVQIGTVLFRVSDFDPLIARIYLPEKDVLDLETGREVRISLRADDETQFRGRIRQISPVVDTATGTVKVTVESEQPPARVRPGAFVTINIVRQTRERVVLVPREAIVRELKEAYVFVANGDVAEKRRVALGLEENGRVQAVSGVESGEQVIVAGQGGLKDGSAITIIPTSEASDLITLNERTRRG
jgi:membrane fusion protein (multidrug efflux system)